MNKLFALVLKLLSCPAFVCAGILAVSVISLAGALVAEHVFGLAPCILCIYQRVPFVIAIVLSAAGLALAWSRPRVSGYFVAACSPVFLVNSAIAFYHTGVELRWWKSALEGCDVPDLSKAGDDILAFIKSNDHVPCDVIPWADPILGLSMANYNVMLCLGMALGCALCAWLIIKNPAKGAFS